MHEAGLIVICGQPVRVVVATEEEVSDLQNQFGACDFEAGVIYVAQGASPASLRDTLVHEVVHYFLHATGIGTFLTSFLAPGVDGEKFEETLVRLVTPHVITLVSQNGPALWRLDS
jgi:hypothetical protein